MSSTGPRSDPGPEVAAAPAGPDPFEAAAPHWTRVSPRLVVHRRAVVLAPSLVPLAALVTGAVLAASPWWTAGFVVWAGAVVWLWLLQGRQTRAIAYAEREDDLLVRKGVLFRTLVVVPYGRMQYVDVSAGPLERALGIATVQLHTASAGTDAAIPGLVPAEAARLRDRLSSRGEARLAGL